MDIKNSGFIMNIVSIGAYTITAFIIWGDLKFYIFKSLKQLRRPLIFLSVIVNEVLNRING